MSGFLVFAILLALGATAMLLVPLLRRRVGASAPALITAAICLVAIAGGSAALYPLWSTWSWAAPPPGSDVENMVGRLARRLETEPDDLEGWLMLGRSYAQMGQYPLSIKSYRRADRLAKGGNAEALAGLGEALILAEQSDLKGEAGKLFERALEADPNSIRALFYGAMAATDRGDTDVARARFQRLLSGNPPPEVRNLIERQLQVLDVESQQRAGAPAGGSGAAAATPSLQLRVTLAPGVAANARKGAPLFVSVRPVGQGGPPLAAKRLQASFPQDVDLGAADSMIAGRGLTAGQEVEITARVANGGTASASKGDPVGTVRHKVGATGARLALTIDSLTP